jgi:hypothetical protein
MIVENIKGGKPKGGKSQLTREQEIDADLVSAIAVGMLSQPQVMEGFNQMLSSGDPVAMAGQFVATSLLKMKEQSAQKMDIDDAVWLAEGGVADRMIDQLIMNLDAEGNDGLRGAQDEIVEEVINVIKLASKSGQQPQGQQPQQGMGPPAPSQQGPVAPMMGGPNG